MENIILKCDKLNKNFGKKKILKEVSFEVMEKDILGFIGPNGAGKTTTIKVILGLQKMSSGTIIINGYDISKNFVNAIEKVGAIVENPDLYMYLSGYKNLELISNMYKNISKKRINEVVKLVKLENRINDKVSKYSLGMRQRLGIAQAILHKPNLLILDEPTNGLDPEGIKDLRDILKQLSEKENMAILISSHNLSELESFCNKVCIIKNGRVIEITDVDNIKHKDTIVYSFEVNNTKQVKNFFDINVIDKNKFTINVEKKDIPDIIKKLIINGIDIYEVKEDIDTLEDAFLKRTGGNKID